MQQGCANRDSESSAVLFVSNIGAQFFLGRDDVDSVLAVVHGVQGIRQWLAPREIRKQRGGQNDFFGYDRLTRHKTRAIDFDDWRAALQIELAQLRGLSRTTPQTLSATGRYRSLPAWVGEPEKTKQRAFGRVLRNVGALTLATLDQLLCRERVERFAHCALADIELDCDGLFAGQRLCGAPGAFRDLLDQIVINLAIQRAIVRRIIHPLASYVRACVDVHHLLYTILYKTWEMTVSVPQLLVHDRRDNVGVVVVEGLQAGVNMLCVVTADNSDFVLTAKQPIPIGHKVALRDLRSGDTVIKYGEDIGKVIAPIAQGEHVHTHNLKTKRW